MWCAAKAVLREKFIALNTLEKRKKKKRKTLKSVT